MHTASLSNDLQYVGRRHNLPRSRANVALVLPATFYTSKKAMQLLFSLTKWDMATRSCTAASDVQLYYAGMAQRPPPPPPPHAPFARRVISALQQSICACACSKSRSPCSCWIVPLQISANPWRQTGIRFISSRISTHRARVFRYRSKHWWHLLWILGARR